MTARRYGRVGVVAAVIALMVFTGLQPAGAGPASPPPRPTSPTFEAVEARYASQPVEWGPCYEGEEYARYRCADIRVPEDWTQPSKGDLSVAISLAEATSPRQRRGAAFINPGGPGDSGIDWPYYMTDMEPDIAAAYDLVGFDPRGVGRSTPLECGDAAVVNQAYDLDGRDLSPANTLAAVQLSARYGAACSSDPHTRFINTFQTIRDMDLVRALLRQPKISYIGFSAGTWLGAWYASTFPDRADRFLLDGNAEWTSTWAQTDGRQDAGFQHDFDANLVPWLAGGNGGFHLGATAAAVNATINARRASLAQHPVTLPDGTRVDPASYDNGIISSLYWTGNYPSLAAALVALEHVASATSDELALVEYWFGSFPVDHGADTFFAVLCQDTAHPSVPQTLATWFEHRLIYPLNGSAFFNPCVFWRTPPTGSPVTGQGMPPVLMVQNDADPATPYEGGVRAHRSTPGSVLVTVRKEGSHTAYGSGNECVDRYANAWLLHGRLPRRDVTCDGLPLPAYGTADTRSTVTAGALSTPRPGRRLTAPR